MRHFTDFPSSNTSPANHLDQTRTNDMTEIVSAHAVANKALEVVRVGNPENMTTDTVLYKNDDGTWSVTDNGEEIVCYTESEVVRVIVENLTA